VEHTRCVIEHSFYQQSTNAATAGVGLDVEMSETTDAPVPNIGISIQSADSDESVSNACFEQRFARRREPICSGLPVRAQASDGKKILTQALTRQLADI